MKRNKQKSNRPIKINLQLFADPETETKTADEIDELEEELFGELEEEEKKKKEEGEETGTDKDKKLKKDNEDDWFMPGVGKTEKEVQKHFKKSQQYIKQLEAKVKEKDKIKDVSTETLPAIKEPKTLVDKAMLELGITDDDMAIDPVGTQKRLLEYSLKVIIPSTVTQPLLNQTGIVRAEIMRDKLRTLYPNFDIDKHEDKVSNIVSARYSRNYIEQNPLKVFQLVIEGLGGKNKKGKTVGNGDEAFTESPTPTETNKAKSKFAQDVRNNIAKADTGNADLFK